MMLRLIFCWSGIAIFGLPLQGQADLFDSDSLLEVQIQCDIEALLADRSDTAGYLPAILSYEGSVEPMLLHGAVKVRGHYRRRADVCAFPPIRLRLKKEARRGTIFQAHKRLKIVTHCQEEEAVLKEYLLYRTFNLLCGYSFRVRLARITYVDLGGRHALKTAYAFFIEDIATLANRLGGRELEEEAFELDQVHREQSTLIYVYAYMIGNLDWDIGLRKNMKFVQLINTGEIIPIPYDFDFAGVVRVSYSGLEEDFEFRRYRKLCRSRTEYEVLFGRIQAAKPQIENLYQNFEYLDRPTLRDMLRYFAPFFRMISRPQQIEKFFVAACPD